MQCKDGDDRDGKKVFLLRQLGVVVVIPPPIPVPPRVHSEVQSQQLVLRVGQWDNG